MTMTTPMAIPIKHRLRTVAASSGSSAKNETTKPKIPVTKINMMPQPKAAFTEPKGAFLILVYAWPLSYMLEGLSLRRLLSRTFL